jgi:hypothetical protein
MPQIVVPEISISAPATEAGINELWAAATRLRDDWYRTASSAGPGNESDAVKLYEKLRPRSRSREALEWLPPKSQGGLTPEELGLKMKPEKNGSPVSKASARAALRVIQTVGGRLVQKGVMTAQVLEIDFSKYDIEGAGRYALTDDARKALDGHLKAR